VLEENAHDEENVGVVGEENAHDGRRMTRTLIPHEQVEDHSQLYASLEEN
jgi:hypothetical protein